MLTQPALQLKISIQTSDVSIPCCILESASKKSFSDIWRRSFAVIPAAENKNNYFVFHLFIYYFSEGAASTAISSADRLKPKIVARKNSIHSSRWNDPNAVGSCYSGFQDIRLTTSDYIWIRKKSCNVAIAMANLTEFNHAGDLQDKQYNPVTGTYLENLLRLPRVAGRKGGGSLPFLRSTIFPRTIFFRTRGHFSSKHSQIITMAVADKLTDCFALKKNLGHNQ